MGTAYTTVLYIRIHITQSSYHVTGTVVLKLQRMNIQKQKVGFEPVSLYALVAMETEF